MPYSLIPYLSSVSFSPHLHLQGELLQCQFPAWVRLLSGQLDRKNRGNINNYVAMRCAYLCIAALQFQRQGGRSDSHA